MDTYTLTTNQMQNYNFTLADRNGKIINIDESKGLEWHSAETMIRGLQKDLLEYYAENAGNEEVNNEELPNTFLVYILDFDKWVELDSPRDGDLIKLIEAEEENENGQKLLLGKMDKWLDEGIQKMLQDYDEVIVDAQKDDGTMLYNTLTEEWMNTEDLLSVDQFEAKTKEEIIEMSDRIEDINFSINDYINN